MKHGFIASNGSFAWITPEPYSRFAGLFFQHNGHLFHVLEHCSFFRTIKDTWLSEDGLGFRIPQGECEARFTDTTSITFDFPVALEFDLALDCKAIYDDRSWGRFYEVTQTESGVIIKYAKKNDAREAAGEEYEFFVTITGPGCKFRARQQFVHRHYPYDMKRNSPPGERYVFDLGTITCKTVTIMISDKRDGLLKLAGFKRSPRLANCYAHARALRTMQTDSGFAAGYPWFYQTWARDELISLGGLIIDGDLSYAKKVLEKYRDVVSRGPLIPSILPQNSLPAMDALGWLALRLEQLSDASDKILATKEMKEWGAMLQKALDALWSERGHTGLIETQSLETWMDTSWNDDGRKGFCLEIQALTLAAHRTARIFNGKKDAREEMLKKIIKSKFVIGEQLLDRVGDETSRPNLFIAAYVAPELFTKKQWEGFIDHALDRLWLPWGGLASLDPKHQLFCKHHTGQNNQSYHRGDSWLWINNIAAIVMLRINAKKYKDRIEKIIEANDLIAEMGAAPYLPELSSAQELRPEGTIAQTWSIATYVELAQEHSGTKDRT